MVLLSGEPGIGKSRLVQVLKDDVIDEAATPIEFHCSPHHRNSALYRSLSICEGSLAYRV
jgi:predicted ATPase